MKKIKKELVKEVVTVNFLEPYTQKWLEIVYASQLTRRVNKGKCFKRIVEEI